MTDFAPLDHVTDRDLVVLAEEIISEMVSMLAALKAPPSSREFDEKFDRFYLKAFGLAMPENRHATVLDELSGGTIQ